MCNIPTLSEALAGRTAVVITHRLSTVRAGLSHAMAEEPGWWTLPPVLPGTDPVAALVRQLATATQQLGLDWTVAKVRHQLDDNGLTGLADELLPAARARRMLVVVDQFEELLTRASPGQRARFAQLLGTALGGPVQVVATLRPEFLNQLLVDSELAVLPTRTHTLRPLRRDALRTVIESPAQLAGITANDDLVTRLVADTDSGEALPLLAFTLSQLADGAGRGDQLSIARYNQLGGVQGALTRQADAALADATKTTGRSSKEGHRRVVAVGRRSGTRGIPFFLAPLAQEIEKNKSALRARRAIEHAATEWNDNGRLTTRLWEGGQLAATRADTGAHFLPASFGGPVTSNMADGDSNDPSRGLWLPASQPGLAHGETAQSYDIYRASRASATIRSRC